MKTRSLFQDAEGRQCRDTSSALSSAAADRVAIAAHRLAVHFTDDEDLPARLRRGSDKSRKTSRVQEGSELEKRFRANVESWRSIIETMISKLDEGLAWRFIGLRPTTDGDTRNVADNQDFRDFIDYMILRRDKEQCGSDELGGLALLSVAFQHEVEKHIQP